MKLTMLGTGNALVTKCYNTCFVIENVNDYFVFSLTTFGQILTNEKEILENLTVSKVKELTQNINSYPYSVFTLTQKKKSC